MEFVEAPAFTHLLADYFTEDAYVALQQFPAHDPDAGDVIPGTGGFRKLRWTDSRRRKGKRGGLRVIYFHFVADSQIWLMTVYGKDEVADLTAEEKRTLKGAVEREARLRAVRRKARRN